MYKSIAAFPEHIRQAVSTNVENYDPKYFEGIDKILFIGMGGSGIAGCIIKDLIGKVPVFINQNFGAPQFIDKNTLAVIISYSGNTKETLESYSLARKKGCRLIGVSSGGKLQGIFRKDRLPFIKLPSGFLPRVSLPYQLFSLLMFFEMIGLYSFNGKHTEEFLEKNRKKIDTLAKGMAKKIGSRMVFVYGSTESVCRRLKTQLNENAKRHAKYEVFPEMNHNEVVAWQKGGPKNICVVIFRDEEKDEITKSIELLKKTIRAKTDIIEIEPEGKSKLEKIVYCIYLGDLISYYLAVQSGVDPANTDYITKLKKVINE